MAQTSQGIALADGTPLKVALARADRRARRRAFLLVAPLLLFVLVTFVLPIGQLLYRSAWNPGFSDNMPALGAWFAANPRGTEPDEAAFAALAADLAAASKAKTIGIVGTRINYEMPGTRSLFTSAARKAEGLQAPYRNSLVALEQDLGRPSALVGDACRLLCPYADLLHRRGRP